MNENLILFIPHPLSHTFYRADHCWRCPFSVVALSVASLCNAHHSWPVFLTRSIFSIVIWAILNKNIIVEEGQEVMRGVHLHQVVTLVVAKVHTQRLVAQVPQLLEEDRLSLF